MSPHSVSQHYTKTSPIPYTRHCTWADTSTRSRGIWCSRHRHRSWEPQTRRMDSRNKSPRSAFQHCTKMSPTPCIPSCTSAGMSTHSQENSSSRPRHRSWEPPTRRMDSRSTSRRSAFPHCMKTSPIQCTPSCTWADTLLRSRVSWCNPPRLRSSGPQRRRMDSRSILQRLVSQHCMKTSPIQCTPSCTSAGILVQTAVFQHMFHSRHLTVVMTHRTRMRVSVRRRLSRSNNTRPPRLHRCNLRILRRTQL